MEVGTVLSSSIAEVSVVSIVVGYGAGISEVARVEVGAVVDMGKVAYGTLLCPGMVKVVVETGIVAYGAVFCAGVACVEKLVKVGGSALLSLDGLVEIGTVKYGAMAETGMVGSGAMLCPAVEKLLRVGGSGLLCRGKAKVEAAE